MSAKLNQIPYIKDYEMIRKEMNEDLQYRLTSRLDRTSLGRPLYYRINVQLIMTQECPHACPFCLERQHPMEGCNKFDTQIESLKRILKEHPAARLTITGGEPGLYPEHVKRIVDTYKELSDQTFCSINTSGWSTELNGLGHINLSINDYVSENPEHFPGCTVQTIMENPNVYDMKRFMNETNAKNFSFRFLTELKKKDYPVNVWNELQENPEIEVHTFRIGDFFVYATFDYNGKHARVTLGDMYQQMHNDYRDGYSNVIIHPDGTIGTNWK